MLSYSTIDVVGNNLKWIRGLSELNIHSDSLKMASLSVVAFRANAIAGDIDQGRDASLLQYHTKPLRIDEFMKTLDIALSYVSHSAQKANNEQ
jgi:hypothetical protein